MDDKKLIQITLGIETPWYVKEIELNTSKKRMDIYLDFTKGTKFPCSICNELCEIHDTKERTWRHLDFFNYESYLHARVPRTKCKEHGVKIVDLPWTRSNTGFTLFFEALVVTMSNVMPVSSVAEMVNVKRCDGTPNRSRAAGHDVPSLYNSVYIRNPNVSFTCNLHFLL